MCYNIKYYTIQCTQLLEITDLNRSDSSDIHVHLPYWKIRLLAMRSLTMMSSYF